MSGFLVRRRGVTLGALSAVVLLIACGEDKRVKELNTGITRDSAVTVLAQEIKGGGSDSFPNVYARERYLANSKNYEVLFFAPNNEKQSKTKVAWSKLTPLVFEDNRLIAKGWGPWDSISKAINVPLKDHSEGK